MAGKMSNDRYREVCAIIGWTYEMVAEKSGYSSRACRGWAANNSVPTDVARWLDDLTVAHLARPAPPQPEKRNV